MKRILPLLLLLCALGATAGDGPALRFHAGDVAAPTMSAAQLSAQWKTLIDAGHPFLVRFDRGPALPAALEPQAYGLRWLAPVPPDGYVVVAVPGDHRVPSFVRWAGKLPAAAKIGPALARQMSASTYRVQRLDEPLRIVAAAKALPLAALLADPRVLQVDRTRPPFRPANDRVRKITGADVVQRNPWNLSGAGVNLGIWDEADVDHSDFAGRLTNMQSLGASEHATHVAGTMAGDGAAGGGLYAGVAPGAKIFAWDFEDPQADLAGEGFANNVAWINNSWTYWIEEAQENCSALNTYDEFTAAYDEFARGSYGQVVGIVFAAGNMADMWDCGIVKRGGYESLPPPGTAKNVITVGSADDGNTVSFFSSRGPTADGRIKPDIVAMGCDQIDDGYITSTLPGDEYGGPGWCGTSMASPQVTGAAGLLLELAERREIEAPSSLFKALFIAGARDVAPPGPSFATGYGHIDLAASASMLNRAAFVVDTLTAEKSLYEKEIDVPVGTAALEVTLAWDDPAANPTASIALVNDLELRLIDPDDNEHLPWVLDPADYDAAATRGADHLNNSEQVRVDNPAAGRWKVRVSIALLVQEQTFSLAGWALNRLDCDRDGDRSPGEICQGDDCDEDDPTIHPGAAEICDDMIDQNCNGELDDGCREIDDDNDDDDDTPPPDDGEDKGPTRERAEDDGGCGCL